MPRYTESKSQNALTSVGANRITQADETRIRAWFGGIDEHDELNIREYLDNCERDPDALAYFLGRVAEVVKAERPPHGSAQYRD